MTYRALTCNLGRQKRASPDRRNPAVAGRPILLVPVVLAGLVLTVRGAGQSTFTAVTDLVPVYATATDPQGRFVPDLRSDEFQLFEDGVRRPIAVMSSDPQPLAAVIMLDQTTSMAAHQSTIAVGAIRFLDRLLDQDRVRIGGFGASRSTYMPTVVLAPAAFTSDRTSLARLVTEQTRTVSGGASPVWQALDRSIGALGGETARRVVLFFSDGHDTPLSPGTVLDESGKPVPRVRSFDDIERRVRLDSVMVYAIGFVTLDALMPSRRRPAPTLQQLAQTSGGGYFEVDERADFDLIFSRIAEELHSQYLIGFTPSARDGGTHEIELRVTRPSVTIRARTHYIAPAPADR